MGIGEVSTHVVVDEPKKIHCGPDDPVTGHVTLHFAASKDKHNPSPADLFGPLRLTVTLHGRAKTKVYRSNGNSRSIYRGRSPLFSISTVVHDGPFRSAPEEVHRFPFAVSFPPGVDTRTASLWKPDIEYDRANVGNLPPTFDQSYHGFAHRFDAFTEYRIGAHAHMPGIDVKVRPIADDQEPHAIYEQPRILASEAVAEDATFSNRFKVQNSELLPEDERPSGIKQKFKAMTKSDYFPEYHFEVFCTYPKRIYLQEPMRFEVRVRPMADLCTAPLWPQLHLTTFSISLHARTIVRAEQSILTEPSSEGNETVLSIRLSTPNRTLPDGPFEKANDMTKSFSTEPLTGGPSSFATFNIVRTYQVEIDFLIVGAGKNFRVKREVPVQVFPPLQGSAPNAARFSSPDGQEAVAGPSSGPRAVDDSVPPGYEDYTRPPAYGEAEDVKKERGSAEVDA